jgi:hypothetical protein
VLRNRAWRPVPTNHTYGGSSTFLARASQDIDVGSTWPSTGRQAHGGTALPWQPRSTPFFGRCTFENIASSHEALDRVSFFYASPAIWDPEKREVGWWSREVGEPATGCRRSPGASREIPSEIVAGRPQQTKRSRLMPTGEAKTEICSMCVARR